MGKVLVVDDEPGIRNLLREVLTEEGHEVVTARDGVEALEMLRGDEGYLVLLDLMMPRLDGRGVLHALEGRHDAGRQHRVIVMSAAERLFAYSAALKSELVREQVAKPFELEALIALVNLHAPAPTDRSGPTEGNTHNTHDGHHAHDAHQSP